MAAKPNTKKSQTSKNPGEPAQNWQNREKSGCLGAKSLGVGPRETVNVPQKDGGKTFP